MSTSHDSTTKTTLIEPPRHQTVLPRVEIDNNELKLLHQQGNRYAVLKKLGEGGAGEVVLVKDQDIYRDIAMKTAKDTDNEIHLVRFVEEARIIGQLEHPNIVPIHDVGVTGDGQYYFTMKYVEGETLRDIIDELQQGNPEYHKKYTFEKRIHVFLEILYAVHFAHDRGYIHRDIKPENVMVGRYGEVMLMDWGIAKRIRDEKSSSLDLILQKQAEQGPENHDERVFQTEHGTVIGTPAYMAPEQVKGKVSELDERTDIYSLTAMLYEFLTLRHYLEHCGHDITAQMIGVLMSEPTDPEKLSNPHQGAVPREYCFFLRHGLKKDPGQRFQNVNEMIWELQSNLEGRTQIHCASTFAKRRVFDFGRFLDNHRHLGVTLLSIIAILAVLGCVQLVSWLMLLM